MAWGLKGLRTDSRFYFSSAIIFAFDYHPLSQTLYHEHLSGNKKASLFDASGPDPTNKSLATSRYHRHRPNHAKGRDGLIEERVIWSYITQVHNIVGRVADSTSFIN